MTAEQNDKIAELQKIVNACQNLASEQKNNIAEIQKVVSNGGITIERWRIHVESESYLVIRDMQS